MNRLTKRKKLVIGGCVFMAIVLGVASTGITPAQAATYGVAMSATGDQMLSSSSDWTWTASDGDLSKTPPLGIGQEVLQGGYSGSVLVSGPGTIESNRGLSSSEILEFSTAQRMNSQGPGILPESLMVYSCGSPSAGVTCGADSLDTEGANLTRQAYCEYAGASGLFMTDSLSYRSVSGISQGDTERPYSLAMDISLMSNGYGRFAAGSRSLIGIGNTTAPGYVHSTSERVGAIGSFKMNGRVRWSSFASSDSQFFSDVFFLVRVKKEVLIILSRGSCLVFSGIGVSVERITGRVITYIPLLPEPVQHWVRG